MDKNGRLSVKFQLTRPRKQNKITKIWKNSLPPGPKWERAALKADQTADRSIVALYFGI